MHADCVNIDITKLENLKLELKNYELEKCKGAETENTSSH
jgi:hypothetical protein